MSAPLLTFDPTDPEHRRLARLLIDACEEPGVTTATASPTVARVKPTARRKRPTIPRLAPDEPGKVSDISDRQAMKSAEAGGKMIRR